MATMFADLHLHTSFSDGTYSPEELVAVGKALGFSALAVTDHDTIEACRRMGAACETAGVEFVPGTELTAEHNGIEVHILGLFIDPEDPGLLSEMAKFQNVRQQRIHEMVERINKLGVPLKKETVFKIASCRSPGRPHVARALVKDGLCANAEEAFERLLKKGKPGWVPKFKMPGSEAIRLIQNSGGLAIMAHPRLNRTDDIIPGLVEAGLDGIECFHTKHSTHNCEHYLEIAEKYELLVTGGSDCHGMSKGRPLIGTIKLPYDYVRRLKERLATKRTAAPSVQASNS